MWKKKCEKENTHTNQHRTKKVHKHLHRQNKNNWKTYIAKHDMNWEQYNIPNDGIRKFLDDFAINGIPRFMLIGKGGKVIDLNVDRPSSLINKRL